MFATESHESSSTALIYVPARRNEASSENVVEGRPLALCISTAKVALRSLRSERDNRPFGRLGAGKVRSLENNRPLLIAEPCRPATTADFMAHSHKDNSKFIRSIFYSKLARSLKTENCSRSSSRKSLQAPSPLLY